LQALQDLEDSKEYKRAKKVEILGRILTVISGLLVMISLPLFLASKVEDKDSNSYVGFILSSYALLVISRILSYTSSIYVYWKARKGHLPSRTYRWFVKAYINKYNQFKNWILNG
jgi:hypothetical protein